MNFEEFESEMLERPGVKSEYDSLAPKYEIIKQIVLARQESKMTQKQLAEKVGTKQSAIARLESGNYNPSMQFLQKIAEALGKKLTVSFC
jgi:ribosome-binding protein aMBF1 (putative translation factor)